MPYDTNVLLNAQDAADSNEGNQTAVNVHGGVGIMVAMQIAGTITGTNPTLDVKVQYSDDGGTTYYDVIVFPQIDKDDRDANNAVQLGGTAGKKVIKRMGWLPRPKAAQNGVGKLRVNTTVGGTSTPTFNDVTVAFDYLPMGIGEEYGMDVLT